MNYQQFLGQAAEVPDVPTIDVDGIVTNLSAITAINTAYNWDKNAFFTGKYAEGGSLYQWSPWNWRGFPRNSLEHGTYSVTYKSVKNWDDGKAGYTWQRKYRLEWRGRAFYFADRQKYLNTLSLIRDPREYVRYLKYAPLAGLDMSKPLISGTWSISKSLSAAAEKTLSGHEYLPKAATEDWWMEAVTYNVLQTSFFLLRAGQIQDRPDLQNVYDNAGKIISLLRSEIETPIPVKYLDSAAAWKTIYLELPSWVTEKLKSGVDQVRHLIDDNREKVAQRIIELSDVDAKIVDTSFSLDPVQNPYLVYNEQRSQEEGKPIFTNVARNESATWAPPEIAGRPENLKYWEQVPSFEQEHARVYMTDQGPMSVADMRKYGMTRSKTNWLPWLAAGAAVAYAASEFM